VFGGTALFTTQARRDPHDRTREGGFYVSFYFQSGCINTHTETRASRAGVENRLNFLSGPDPGAGQSSDAVLRQLPFEREGPADLVHLPGPAKGTVPEDPRLQLQGQSSQECLVSWGSAILACF